MLEEVTLACSSATLRRLAEFLVHAADMMDLHGDSFGHEHFEDFSPGESPRPAFIVTRDPSGNMKE
jgi:hypothetical protein